MSKKHQLLTYGLLFPLWNRIKIGVTTQIEQRVRTHESFALTRCVILGLRDGNYEGTLKRVLDDCTVDSAFGTEWFCPRGDAVLRLLKWFNGSYPEAPPTMRKELSESRSLSKRCWHSFYMRPFLKAYFVAAGWREREKLMQKHLFFAERASWDFRRGRLRLARATATERAFLGVTGKAVEVLRKQNVCVNDWMARYGGEESGNGVTPQEGPGDAKARGLRLLEEGEKVVAVLRELAQLHPSYRVDADFGFGADPRGGPNIEIT